MRVPTSQRLTVATELRSRLDSVSAGAWSTLAFCVPGLSYALATWSGPNRPLLVALIVLAGLSSVGALLVPRRRIVQSRWREGVFLAWSLATIAFIAVASALDGGAPSPFALVFFLPVVFAALTYPLASVLVVGALDVVAYAGVGVLVGSEDPVKMAFFASSIAVVALMCALQARAGDRHRRELSHCSLIDPLTACLNRRGFEERLRLELDEARAAGCGLALVLLDLDHFKALNDTHGHATGDRVLRAVGERLRSAVRAGDVVARVGGEEFALILPVADADTARAVAERARAGVGTVSTPDGNPVSCSAGVALSPTDASEADGLFELADAALYWAKRTGRGHTRRFDPAHLGPSSASARRDEVVALLECPDSVTPVFQPLVDLATGRVAGYEALSRFGDDFPGGPARWFPQAWEVGLGAELEARALAAALARPNRPAGTFLTVNVSPAALGSPALAAVLPAELDGLVLEVTEQELAARDPELDDRLAHLRARGARVAIDDVGAGSAGLNQVVRLRPDVVKLDRSLVAGVHSDPARLALVESFVRFARRVGAAVCAEGIERRDDLAVLADIDVHYGQGFLLARPATEWRVPPQELSSALLRRSVGGGHAGGLRGDLPDTGDLRLERACASLSEISSLEDLLPLAGLIAAELGADDAVLSRFLPEAACVETVADTSTRSAPHYALAAYPATERVLWNHEPVQIVVSDPAADAHETALLRDAGYGSLLMLPAVARGRPLGLIELLSRSERPWTHSQINRARIIAYQLAAVLERSTAGHGAGMADEPPGRIAAAYALVAAS